MTLKKRIINFKLRSDAYERNKLIRNEMSKVRFTEIVKGILIYSDGRRSMNYHENRRLEEADKIVVYYL